MGVYSLYGMYKECVCMHHYSACILGELPKLRAVGLPFPIISHMSNAHSWICSVYAWSFGKAW